MSSELRNISSYVPLDNYYESFTYITGPDSTHNKYTLEISGNIIKNWHYRNETLMACFCELGLFGRWHWVDDTTALLYF
ncbi:13234_t:CDS:1, partial [Funneliformis geosporum]